MVIVLMGVSGCGKTSVGLGLAEQIGGVFEDGDDYHPQINVDKMREGIPLTDDDRMPWLDTLAALMHSRLTEGKNTVVACSALAKRYRERLKIDTPGIHLVYLKGSFDLINGRLQSRQNHYMPSSLLKSQFESLEEPTADEQPIVAEIDQPLDEIVEGVMRALKESSD